MLHGQSEEWLSAGHSDSVQLGPMVIDDKPHGRDTEVKEKEKGYPTAGLSWCRQRGVQEWD